MYAFVCLYVCVFVCLNVYANTDYLGFVFVNSSSYVGARANSEGVFL